MRTWGAILSGLLLVAALDAAAVQFTPTATARLHTLTNLTNEPGAEWNTDPTGPSGGQLSYSSGTQRLSLAGELDVLNYYDPLNGSCPTDSGSNCFHNYGTDLTFMVDADLNGLVVTNLGGGFFQVDANFQSTGSTDITVVDPTDSTTVLTAMWQAGTFLGSPTTGLNVTLVYDAIGGTVIGTPTAVGFAAITGGLYASLFDNGSSQDFAVNISNFFDFSPSLNSLVAGVIGSGTLGDFTAEGLGQVFSVAAGNFVPEPGVGLLLGSILVATAVARRRLG